MADIPDLPDGHKQRMQLQVLELMGPARKIWDIGAEFIVDKGDRTVVVFDDKIAVLIRAASDDEIESYKQSNGEL